jgi:type I restriction enzyme S subunit
MSSQSKNLRASASPCETQKEDATPALVPKLRFPEFRNAGEWTKMTFCQAAKFYNGRAYKQEELLESGKYPVLRVGNFFTNNKWYYSDLELDETKYCDNGDLLYAWSASFGPHVWRGTKVIYHYHIWKVEEHRGINRQFLFITLENETETMKAKSANGLGLLHITKGTIEGWETSFPAPAEQQKIAECLSSLDELMAAQARKLEALKEHKKGLMQRLFPREGETHPRLRFPEFRDAGEWEERRLEDLARRGSGHTPSKSHPDYYNGGIKWVSLADSKRLDCGLISDTTIKISDKGIRNSSAVLHPAGTVLISRDAGIGKSAVMSESMAVSQHFIVWNCKQGYLSNWFLYHLLQNSKPRFERAATGSTIKTIGLQFFIELVFRFPTFAEQHRIATCLSSLDALITAETQKLEAFKTHKRGLMQQLFPSPFEQKTL